MQLDLERSNRHLFHSIIPPHSCSCVENKREKACFVLRIECWTPEFEAEVLTITRRCFLLGLQCRDTDQKGNCSPVWPQQYGTGIWKRYKVWALLHSLQSSAPRTELPTLITSLPSGLPSLGFRVTPHGNKTRDSSVSTVSKATTARPSKRSHFQNGSREFSLPSAERLRQPSCH